MKFVEGYINRKSLINKTSIGENNYAINHVQGCAHGCLYPCFAYLMAKRFGKVNSYADWCKPYVVKNSLALLDNEIAKIKNKTNKVHLCFATDPFMHEYEEIAALSVSIIRKLNYHGLACSILTKGILPFELAGLAPDNEYGISLVSLDESYRRRCEPGAAPYKRRLNALHTLQQLGCKTYVNIEPYPTPNILKQDICELMAAVSFVSSIGFGRTNYNEQVDKYSEQASFYEQTRAQITEFCAAQGIACQIHG